MKRSLGIVIAFLFCFYMIVPSTAQASTVATTANVVINDLFNNVTGTATGFDPADLSIVKGIEMWDMHGEYVSTTAPPVGVSYLVNFNIFDPAFEGGGLSDTLSVVFTGHTPTGGDPDNISVDLHFRSDPNVVLLPGAFVLTETGQMQDLSPFLAMAPAAGGAGVTDFNLSFVSAVPEPASFMLLALGLATLAGTLRRNHK